MINSTLATSIRYGNYKHMQHNSKRWQKAIERNWALICKALGIDETTDVNINWRPIKATVKGTYCSANNVINMDTNGVVIVQKKAMLYANTHTDGEYFWNSMFCMLIFTSSIDI